MRVPTALVGCAVYRTAFDQQVRLLLVDSGRVDAELVIETTLMLRDTAGTWHHLEPGTGAALAPVLDLFGHTVRLVEVRGAGALLMAFDSGMELRVYPHPHYESWDLTGTGVAPITVGPGGHPDWDGQ
ncbi:hypothetical protein Val02_92330 [Virgisporangium aliadipatigenens]|uniref:Uncharacterized protein n=1 Tax=Virgisporangium aliadipatigenens TaxID=741659 RepID=A0A8J4DXR7_9ACTN|nr:DUF6188 family protein [Virgisporangium aliadipatigenens]GIJ52347.1 hypothetical protein Val02_92330 [Virgisporangium aliadipatigenens]